MTAAGVLTEQDVAAVREAVAGGAAVPVWFTAAAVGVPVGGSAKVVGVGDAAEGDFIQVRPAGSRDTVFCSPAELTRTRPSRRKVAPAPARARTSPAPVSPARTRPVSAPPVEKAPVEKAPVEMTPVEKAPVEKAPVEKPMPSRRSAPKAVAPRAVRSGAMTVTLRATVDGEWTVDVLVGKERIVSAVAVPAADVAAAGRSLPPAVAGAIEESLEGARRRQRERVERLRAELDDAQRLLDRFDS